MSDQHQQHVFISYVRENQEQVDRLYENLKEHGVIVWLDRYDITAGILWEDAIRQAIREGAFFIACFSKEYNEKTTTYMNEELNLAIEVLRKRPRDQAWFIPVVLPGGGPDYVPDWEIFPGKTLRSIQWVPLYEDWDAGIQRILSVIKPIPPEIQNLIIALRSEDRKVRNQALEALGKIGDPSAVPALITSLKDQDSGVRLRAAQSLKEIGPKAKTAVSGLIEMFKDESKPIRKEVSQALVNIGSEAIPALIEALRNEDNVVCIWAQSTLRKIGPEAKAVLPVLIGALKKRETRCL